MAKINRYLLTFLIVVIIVLFVFSLKAQTSNSITEFLNINSSLPNIGGSQSIWSTIFSFLLAGFLGALVSYRRDIDAYGFAVMEAHIILAFAAALMMMIIGSELARAFGLMGAAAIVRYRYSLNNPREASSLVIALGLGMACGVGLYLLAIIAAIFVRIGYNIFNILPMWIIRLLFDVRHNFLLKVTIPTVTTSIMIEEIDEIFSQKDLRYKLVSSKEKKSAPEQTILQYEITLQNLNDKDEITQQLKDLRFEVIELVWTEKKADKVSDYLTVRSD